MSENYRVVMKDIHKSFGNIRSLQGINLTLQPGEVLGLVGDNGAGKSTLMKTLSGVIVPDKGDIYFEGEKVTINSPKDAKDLHIETVFQDLSLCDTLSASSNMFLGREHVKKSGFIDFEKMHQQAEEELSRLGINIPSVELPVMNMSGGQRQTIAIARSMIFNPKVLILDEPTAALGVNEVEMVLEMIKSIKKEGVSVILITHRLQDLFEVCDRIMVLYEGKNFDERSIEEYTLETLIKSIMGSPEEVDAV